jgi:hypothetical protein
MALDQELRRIAEAAVIYCGEGEELAGIVPAEPSAGLRLYVCAYGDGDGDGDEASWLVLDSDGSPVEDSGLVKDAVSIAALYELAEEAAGSGREEDARVATPALLDALRVSAEDHAAFTEAMKGATGTVEELLRDVERGYKLPLS